jgi:hypothetical protein
VISCSEFGMTGIQARRRKTASTLAISGPFGGFGGLNPSDETLAIGTLCRERCCEWRRSEGLVGIRSRSGKWPWSG